LGEDCSAPIEKEYPTSPEDLEDDLEVEVENQIESSDFNATAIGELLE